MANLFPIGPNQIIYLSPVLQVLINNCDFDPNFNGYMGYKRSFKKDYLKKVTHQIIGTPNISGRRHPQYFEFEWQLFISASKYALLMGIWNEQTYQINSYSTTFKLLLQDRRYPLLVKIPKERAGDYTIALPEGTPSIIPGYTYIYPVFNIFIDDIEGEMFIPNKQLYKVAMKATELSVLNTSFDVN